MGFRFSPSVILSASGGYGRYENHEEGLLYSGLYAGLSLQFTFTLGRSAMGIEAEFAQDDPVYPPFLPLYQKVQAGTLAIINHENAELRNVEVSFRAGEHMSSEFICGVIPFIGRDRRESMPLYADFSPKLLGFTENGRIMGEVVIRYSLLGARREIVQSAALQIAHRNSVPAGGPVALAAFVSPTAPELLEYAKHIIGMARLQNRAGLSRNMQFGIWLFEGFLAAGLRRQEAGSSGFSAFSDAVEDVQYPAQTLAYRSGSAAVIGLAYAAALEASGIPSAFIPLSDDFIVALCLGITGKEAQSLFSDVGNILIIDDEAWLPLSMAAFDEGFSKSWGRVLERIDRIEPEEAARLVILQDAWTVYPPVPFPALGVRIAVSDTKDLETRAAAALEEYVAAEIQPLIALTLSEIRRSAAGPDLAALYNRLGAMRVRAGDMAEARAAYERAANLGSVPAAMNLGNMALRENNLTTARRWFDQALRLQPGNQAALRGLEQISLRTRE
jgi:tetratricopeptide (TPR) repeat protein